MSNKKILDHFYNLKKPTAYSSASNIKKHMGVKNVDKVLSKEFPYSLYRPRYYKFKRLRTIPTGFMADVQCDLADFQSIKRFNKGYAYCLLLVDVMSRQIFAVPTKSKKFVDMKIAFDQLFEKLPKAPTSCFTDKGKEFESRDMHAYFKQLNIAKYHGETDGTKASVCERFIRVLKSRIYKYMAAKNTKTWHDVLDIFTNAINNSFCRAIAGKPSSINDTNWWPLWKKLYSYKKHDNESKLSVGDYVRLSLKKQAFDKSYLSNYTDEVFKISHVYNSNPITYQVTDFNGEPIIGRVYRKELSLSDKDTAYRVEKIIRKRVHGGITEYFVKWVGSHDNSWIKDDDFRDVLPSVAE